MWVACVGMGVLMLDGCVQRAGSLLSGPAEARAEAPFKMVSAAPLTAASSPLASISRR